MDNNTKIRSYDLRGIRRCLTPGHTNTYVIPAVFEDSDGATYPCELYVSSDTTLSCGSISCTIRELHEMLSGIVQTQVTLTPITVNSLFEINVPERIE